MRLLAARWKEAAAPALAPRTALAMPCRAKPRGLTAGCPTPPKTDMELLLQAAPGTAQVADADGATPLIIAAKANHTGGA